ncbi:MAG: N-acetyltransferase [Myxococcales bacterium]|nr:MAG: N-acetyltransferase [Myxococcales bacterium]
MSDAKQKIEIVDSLARVDAASWDALVDASDPFMEYGFLRALELSRAVGEGTGWLPRYVLSYRADRLEAAAAAYLKLDSYGEFVFDWEWADAYHRAGLAYYPKLVVAAPFTPAGGTRILVRADTAFEASARPVVDALVSLAEREGLSGVHLLFVSEPELAFLASCGFLPRLTYQFHWENNGYADFDAYLEDLRASKRKQIRKERKKVADYGFRIEVLEGADIRDEHVDAIWRFYRNTTGRKWGEAYLRRDSFDRIAELCRERLVLVMASEAGRWVAGTFNLCKGTKLFGRYWGALEDYPGLHFECCYYLLIEYAIERRLQVVEAGAQGEHKFLRGFVTRPTYSAHWLAHPGGRAAIERYLEGEREQTRAAIEGYNGVSPVKRVRDAAGRRG